LLENRTIDTGLAGAVNAAAPENGSLIYTTEGLLPKTSAERRDERRGKLTGYQVTYMGFMGFV